MSRRKSATLRLSIDSASVEVETAETPAKLSPFERLGLVALRLADARRLRNEAKALLNPPRVKGLSASELQKASHDLQKGRKEWRAASSQLWRLAERISRGQT